MYPDRTNHPRGPDAPGPMAKPTGRRRRPDELLVALDPEGSEPLRRQLAAELRESIRAGRLRAGVRLPASRALARAARRVARRGHRRVRAADRRGLARLAPGRRDDRGGGGAGTARPTARPRRPARRPRFDFTPTTRTSRRSPAASGRRRWRARPRRRRTRRSTTRTDTAGWSCARRSRATSGACAARHASPGDIVVCSGYRQATALMSRSSPRRGARRIASRTPPCATTGRVAARGPGSSRGRPARRRRACARTRWTGARRRGVVITPSHQFPTGAVMGAERRHELLAWARQATGSSWRTTTTRSSATTGARSRALQGLDPARVAYVGHGVEDPRARAPPRLGAGAARARGDLAEAKHAADPGSPALDQLALADLFASGAHERNLRAVRRDLRRAARPARGGARLARCRAARSRARRRACTSSSRCPRPSTLARLAAATRRPRGRRTSSVESYARATAARDGRVAARARLRPDPDAVRRPRRRRARGCAARRWPPDPAVRAGRGSRRAPRRGRTPEPGAPGWHTRCRRMSTLDSPTLCPERRRAGPATSSCSPRSCTRSSSSRVARPSPARCAGCTRGAAALRAGRRLPRGPRCREPSQKLPHEEVEPLIRACAMQLQLANIAEERERVRRRRHYDRNRRAAARVAGAADAARAALAATLDALDVQLVLTAHPTEATRRTILDHRRRDRGLLEALEVAGTEGVEGAESWSTSCTRRSRCGGRPTRCAGCARASTTRSARSSSSSSTSSSTRCSGCGRSRAPLPARRRAAPVAVRTGSWAGGDMDGNPSVGADALLHPRAAPADRAAPAARPHPRARPRLLAGGGAAAALGRAARLARARRRGAAVRGGAHGAAQPARAAATQARFMGWRLNHLMPAPTPGSRATARPRACWPTSRCCAGRSARHRVERGALARFEHQVDTFGFHLARLDVRQSADRLQLAVAALVPGYGAAGEEERRTSAVGGDRRPRVDSAAAAGSDGRALAVFEALSRCAPVRHARGRHAHRLDGDGAERCARRALPRTARRA